MPQDDHHDSGPDEELVPEDDAIIGVAFKWSLLALALIVLAVVAGRWLARERPAVAESVQRGPIEAPPSLDQTQAEMPRVRFVDITGKAGIDFVHTSGATGQKLLPETMGGGAAFFDYDGDGDPDLLLVNSDDWPEAGDGRPTMALYRNDGLGHFDDVTAEAGLDVSFYGQGVAVGDYDNDGRIDVFLSALGPNHLFRNTRASFRDVTDQTGVAGAPDGWSSSAGFFDYDNDGDLDLFVCNYVQWSRELDLQQDFTLNGTDRAYGPPKQYQGTHSSLYRNDGDGTFTDVSERAGIVVANPATGRPIGKALAVTFADANGDGWQDVFVANDTVQNFVFLNRGDGTFEEVGATSGIGFDNAGNATGAMGIDIGDVVNDGTLAVSIANFANEATSFYVQQQDRWQFVDRANAEGIGSPSRLRLSFGLFFFDYDLDGRLDLLQANGHLEDDINEVQSSQHYRQSAQLFWNCSEPGDACYAAVPEAELGDLAKPIVGRGATYADIDGDGDLDVLLTQTGDRPLLVRNDQQLGHHWLRVRLVGRTANRDAIGSWVEVSAGGRTQRRQLMPTRSYLSQVELPITFGLGREARVEWLRVSWPGGQVQEVAVDSVDSLLVIEQAG